MARPFSSLLLAAAATVAGLALTWHGVNAQARALGRLTTDGAGIALALAGILLLGVAAFSLAIHWVGALVVGSVHGILGLFALVVPFGNEFGGGIFSPVFQITRMLSRTDAVLGDEAMYFYFSGTALVVGAFLAGAALAVRSRRVSEPSTPTAVAVSAVFCGVTLVVAIAILFVAGGDLARSIATDVRYDGALAAIIVVAGVFAGVSGLALRWSSLGAGIVGAVVLVIGLVLVAGMASLPPGAPGGPVATHGLLAIAGVSLFGAALGAFVGPRPEVPGLRAGL